jgi:hypothetical protein
MVIAPDQKYAKDNYRNPNEQNACPAKLNRHMHLLCILYNCAVRGMKFFVYKREKERNINELIFSSLDIILVQNNSIYI